MPREYLERLRTIDRELDSMLDHKQEILEQATSIKSMPDGVWLQSGRQGRIPGGHKADVGTAARGHSAGAGQRPSRKVGRKRDKGGGA